MINRQNNNVFFLVDANNKIGSGHLIRCRLIAEELTMHRIDIFFVFTETDNSYKAKIQLNFKVLDISKEDSYQASRLAGLIQPVHGNSMLIIDSDDTLYYNAAYHDAIRSFGIKLMIITVNSSYRFNADLLLNQNIIALEQNYTTAHYTRKLLGPQYFIFDKKFRTRYKRKVALDQPYCLMITFGGADLHNLTGKMLQAVKLIRNYFSRIIIVAGGLNKNLEGIRAQIQQLQDSKVELHIDTDEMPELMKKTDVAITAAGLTFWELASMQIPCFMIASSEREKPLSAYFNSKKYCIELGVYDKLPDNMQLAHTIARELDETNTKSIRINELTEKINRNGVELVAREIIKVLNNEEEI